MNDNEIEFPADNRIDREAAFWVAKRIKGFEPGEQDSYFEWLAEDPRHGEWYARHMNTWKRLDQLAQWKPEHSERPNQDLLKYHMTRRSWAWLSGTAAAIIAICVYWMSGDIRFSDGIADGALETGHSSQNLVAQGYESHVLPDGSIVEMNSGAALKVDYTPGMRRIELYSSEAHFDVATYPDRPFVVHAGGVDFRAVGTAFNVRLREEAVEMLVTEGRVEMTSAESLSDGGSSEASPVTRGVVAGQKLVASLRSETLVPEVVEVSIEEVDAMLNWKPLLLEFDETPLSEVVATFNRHNTMQLEIADPVLSEELIVASFRTTNVNHFVELLEWTLDVESEQVGEDLILLRRR